eukprot:CAMPEP_0114513526 /NCGR_PEP_ID=MMETSP0109-20121206/15626_1 /TAXON_ID=29199 /ORGANISM="Chlorarachnion reptans, Strain CCCM449" /LENGTH=977 /DNA_ID=CAMNT_0001693423 /DNA_START=11 /DNA_END=2944 /DNA_ORIENTATION=+
MSDQSSSTEKAAKQARIATKVREEIVSTEETYVEQLNQLIQLYIDPLRKMCHEAAQNKKNPPLDQKELSTLFGNIETIFSVNQHFLTELRRNKETEAQGKGIGAIFLEFAPYFKMYTDYVGNHDRATDLLAKIQKNNSRKYNPFKNFLEQKEQTVLLSGLLILPIQRVPRYRLLLQELVKRTEPADKDYPDLTQALELIKQSATHINEAVKRMDRSRKVRAVQEQFVAGTTFVSPSRQFIKEGHAAKLSDRNRYRQKYQFVLFNDLFVYADTQKLTKKFKIHWQSDINDAFKLEDLEDNEGSRYKFQFEIIAQDKAFTMVFKDAREKSDWKSAICKCIEDRKSALDYAVKKKPSDNKMVSGKPQRPARPSAENIAMLFDLHHRLEEAKVLMDQQRNGPPSHAARVMYDYNPQEAEELEMKIGDTVEVLEFESEHGVEWWRGEINGRSGIFPSNYVKLYERCWFNATADYKGDGENELDLKMQDVVKVTKMATGGWWYAKNMRTLGYGWLPANYVEECEENYDTMQLLSARAPASARSKSVGEGGVFSPVTEARSEKKKRTHSKNSTFSAKTISILTNFFKMRPQKTDLVKKGIFKERGSKSASSSPRARSAQKKTIKKSATVAEGAPEISRIQTRSLQSSRLDGKISSSEAKASTTLPPAVTRSEIIKSSTARSALSGALSRSGPSASRGAPPIPVGNSPSSSNSAPRQDELSRSKTSSSSTPPLNQGEKPVSPPPLPGSKPAAPPPIPGGRLGAPPPRPPSTERSPAGKLSRKPAEPAARPKKGSCSPKGKHVSKISPTKVNMLAGVLARSSLERKRSASPHRTNRRLAGAAQPPPPGGKPSIAARPSVPLSALKKELRARSNSPRSSSPSAPSRGVKGAASRPQASLLSQIAKTRNGLKKSHLSTRERGTSAPPRGKKTAQPPATSPRPPPIPRTKGAAAPPLPKTRRGPPPPPGHGNTKGIEKKRAPPPRPPPR